MNMFRSIGLALKGAAAQRAPLGRGFGVGSMLFCEDDAQPYADAVRDAYASNAVAQRAVRLVAEGVAGAPLSCSDPRLAALVSATSAGQCLLETVTAHLLLHGNAYVQLLGEGGGRPRELFALRPERVTVQPDAQGWPAAFVYRVGERSERFEADPLAGRGIIHVRTFNPSDDHYGLGCLGAAGAAVRAHNAASRWNRALLENAARPSGALVYDPGDAGAALSPDQFARLKAELEASYQGGGNAGRPMLLEGGLRWQPIAMSPAEMDFAALKDGAAREIALAFGVPPMLLGLPGDNSYANYREANRALWRLTLLPMAAKILDALAEGLAPWFPGATLSIDLDRVPALAEDRERLWAQVTAADFLTREEKRALLGVD